VNALVLFMATFVAVFALGLQSLNVNGRHFVAAGLTSLLIGCANLVLFKSLPGPTGNAELVAYLVGGPAGIICAMLAHPLLVGVSARQRQERAAADARVSRLLQRMTELQEERNRLHSFAQAVASTTDLGEHVEPVVRDRAMVALGRIPMRAVRPAPGARRA
jgi:hypothetical protein